MLLSVPIYVEVQQWGGQAVHYCTPLFFKGPYASHAHLGLALSKMNERLKQHLDRLGASLRHDSLAACAFSPSIETHVLKLSLDVRDRVVKCRFLFVTFAALGRRIAFTPSVPELWFELWRDGSLELRATEVLTRHFRDLRKLHRSEDVESADPERKSLHGQAWVTPMDVQVNTRQTAEKDLQKMLARLFDDAAPDGAAELRRVGRCLDWLYPNELHRAIARDVEVAKLDLLLKHKDNRPVAIIGPRLVGKTTVLHECVRRRVARRGKPFAAKENVWLLSPQRLISGMMYVGQWETRLQAILRVAARRRHVLYFDDFLGLYFAGISRDASLSVADVLKPFIHRRDVRVATEMTPEAWQTLQERDRGLADQFHVLRIAPTTQHDTRRVMIEVHRQLESEHRCTFTLQALPLILELHESYLRDAAFPGKSAGFSRQLAHKLATHVIAPADVRLAFHQKTGLSMSLLDDDVRIERQDLIATLRHSIVGQQQAVDAVADVVQIAKTRLADPGRPLSTLLLLGPTGVGKTSCAKALAEVLFSDATRLLRFDMNEFVSSHAAAQLIGTTAEPDGLLTSAVRRQPFSVVLLDEIEKAHPDVFDVLLQVTGEGRLTDALGRTSDFSNTVIVMTSNLGTTAESAPIGIATSHARQQHTYTTAAERFFRPEFFNRIDRVVPFDILDRDQMREVAELQIRDVFQRDGLVRRRCTLAVEPQAMERIVDAGYHPQFGARALKRAIERQLVQPVAATLANVNPDMPAIIGVYPKADGVIAVVHPLHNPEPIVRSTFNDVDAPQLIEQVDNYLMRIASPLESLRAEESVSDDGLSATRLWYYALKEQLHHVRDLRRQLGESAAMKKRGSLRLQIQPHSPVADRVIRRQDRQRPEKRLMRDIQAARDIHEYLANSVSELPRAGELPNQMERLRREVAMLYALEQSASMPQDVVLVIHPIHRLAQRWADQLLSLKAVFGEGLGFHTESFNSPGPDAFPVTLRISGPGIWPLVLNEAGLHIYCRQHENLLPVQIAVFPATDEPLGQQLAAIYMRREKWIQQVASGRPPADRDPWALDRIVRLYDQDGATLDLRSGLSCAAFPDAEQWKTLLLSGLPLPPELESCSP